MSIKHMVEKRKHKIKNEYLILSVIEEYILSAIARNLKKLVKAV